MDFDVDLPDLTCPDLFLISVERVTNANILLYNYTEFKCIILAIVCIFTVAGAETKEWRTTSAASVDAIRAKSLTVTTPVLH